jgi:two-component system sensor histidine kinase YesM
VAVVSLRRRFNLAFLLLVFLPGLLVNVALARLYLSALFSTVSRQTEAVLAQVARSIAGEVNGISILVSALFHDADLRAFADLYSQAGSAGARLPASNRLNDKLVSFLTFSDRVGAVVLFMRDGGSYYYSNYPNLRSVASIDRAVYAEAKKDPGKVFLLDSLSGVGENIGEKFIISVAVCPGQRDYDTRLDAILVMFRVPYFDQLASRSGTEPGSDLVIYGRDGRMLLSSLPETIEVRRLASPVPPSGEREGEGDHLGATGGPSFRQVVLAGRSWLASSLRMETTGWTIVLLADRSAITGRITSYQWYLYPALALLTVLFLVYAGIFLSRIANPIRELIGSMRRAGKGDYSVRVPAAGIEELAALTGSFNLMMDEIHQLTKEREQRDRERVKAELEALRFQINPHFVSNTLNSIRLMALAANAGGIGQMTQDLMRILADSSTAAGSMTNLAHEIGNLQSYVGIMKVRFGENFAVRYEIAPETRELLILRMILQPIVENAILHGFMGAGRRGTISICSRLEEIPGAPATVMPEAEAPAAAGRGLVIEVRDDGVGMDPALAFAASEGERSGLHHIGLANVQRRIKLNFGEPFGLSVQSERGRFTLVRFLLPEARPRRREDA